MPNKFNLKHSPLNEANDMKTGGAKSSARSASHSNADGRKWRPQARKKS
jgi:hypothetical protein